MIVSENIRKYIVESTFWYFNEITKKHEEVCRKSKWYTKPHHDLPNQVLLFSLDKPYDHIVISERIFSMCFKRFE